MVAIGFQPCSPNRIALFSSVPKMSGPIHFNNQLRAMAGKIGVIRTDLHLPPNMMSKGAKLSERSPKLGFGNAHILPQMPRSMDAHTPTLCPSPQGGGRRCRQFPAILKLSRHMAQVFFVSLPLMGRD